MGKKTVAVMMACMLAVTLVGCSKKKADDSAATASSTTTESKSESSVESTTTTKKSDSSTDATDLTGELGALGASGDCVAIAASYASVYLSALGVNDDASKQQLEDELNQLKSKVPSDVQDALDTIDNGIRNADGFAGIGKFFDSQEYKDADKKVTDYLNEHCNFGSNGSNN